VTPLVPSDRLSFKDGTFSGFVSDALGALRDRGPVMPRTIAVRSARTGRAEEFVYVRAETDREGDVRAWNYVNRRLALNLVLWNT
jgi:hypothetical protein